MMANPTTALAAVAQDDSVWVHGRRVAIPAGQWPQGATPRALLRFAGPVQADWRRTLQRQRLTVHFWCPPAGACVQMPSRYRHAPASLQALGFALGGRDYEEALCLRSTAAVAAPALRRARALPAEDSAALLPGNWHDIVCFQRTGVPQVR
jgi:hypothetical protein